MGLLVIGHLMLRAWIVGSVLAMVAVLVAMMFKLDVGACLFAVSPISGYLGWRSATRLQK